MADRRMFDRHVLLVNPPQDLTEVMGRAGQFLTRWEPLGLLYIAAVLIDHGYDVCILDAEADPHTLDEVLDAVEAYDPAVVGITCLTPTAPPAVMLGQRICQTYPQRTVVMGNVHAHVFAETLLRPQACQFVVHGAGDSSSSTYCGVSRRAAMLPVSAVCHSSRTDTTSRPHRRPIRGIWM